MTAETHKGIPGRGQAGEEHKLDRMMFGDRDAATTDAPKAAREKDVRVRFREYPANDDGETAEDPTKVGEISFVERAARERRRKEDRRRSYSRLPDERGNFGAENSKRGPMLAALAIGVVAVFGVVVWNTYRDGLKTETTSVKPKVIPGGSFKSKPEAEASAEGDGAQVFDQVQGVPGALDGGPAVPAVAPSVEPTVAASAEPSPEPSPIVKAEVKPEITPPVAPPKAETKPEAIAPKPAAVAPKPEPKLAPSKVVAASVAPVATPKTPPVKTPAETTPAKAAAFTPAFSAGGPFVVQLAALANEADAEAAWAKAVKIAPALLTPAEKIVVKAEVNGKTVYRVRAGAFAKAGDAEAFCAEFKARGGVCFRAAR